MRSLAAILIPCLADVAHAQLRTRPTAIPPGSLVKYTVNGQGEVSAVWILSEQEAAR